MYALVYTCKEKKTRRKSRRYASDSHVASVILSVYYAKRWAENNSFSRVFRSIRSDPSFVGHRASRERLTSFTFKHRALCAKTQETKFINDSQGWICERDGKVFQISFLNRSETWK